MANATLKERVEAIYRNPTQLANARDYLNMLAASEGTATQGNNGYNIMFRGGVFNDYSAHPNQRHEYIDKQGRKGVSTAAGRYQFLKGTYDGVAKQLGITDFSPESQDKVAIALMLQKGVDFNDGADLASNVGRINNVWTSLAGSTLGAQYHSTRDPQFLLNAFNQSRAARGAQPVTTTWGGTTYQSPAGYSTTSGGAGMPANIKEIAAKAQSYLESIGLPNSQSYLGNAMASIRNKTYADSGYIPWQLYQGNKFTVSSNPYLNEGNLASMEQRLHNANPNVQYGVSQFGDGMHPTVAVQNPDGTVGIGTDVATTIAVAPALSDGGVPVEDATLGSHAVTPQTQLVEDTLQAPLKGAPAQPATSSNVLPTATPKTQPRVSTAGASATPATTPPASTGASQTASTQPAGTPAVGTQQESVLTQFPVYKSPAEMMQSLGLTTAPVVPTTPVGNSVVPLMNQGAPQGAQQPVFTAYPVDSGTTTAAPNDTVSEQTTGVQTVGAWGVPMFMPTGAMDADTASALLQNITVKPIDMPKAQV